ncbi:hypothetical protein CR513_36679, partial [Mucuna pruriens]
MDAPPLDGLLANVLMSSKVGERPQMREMDSTITRRTPISFFSEKLKGVQLNYSTYDGELYTFHHYLLSNEFIVHHESLKHLKSQLTLNKRHEKWVEFLEQFSYVIKHTQGQTNIVVDAFSKRHVLLAMLETKLLDLYVDDDDFKEAYESCANSANGSFFKCGGFLFKENQLYVPKSSIRELLVREEYEGGLIGHFGERKTYKSLHEYFYWPCMKRDVHHVCERYLVFKMAKSKASSNGLYTPFPIPTSP